MANKPIVKSYGGDLASLKTKLSEMGQAMLRKIMHAFTTGDVQKAIAVWHRDDGIDHICGGKRIHPARRPGTQPRRDAALSLAPLAW